MLNEHILLIVIGTYFFALALSGQYSRLLLVRSAMHYAIAFGLSAHFQLQLLAYDLF